MASTESGPDALKSSSPILATPNHSSRSRAKRVAATMSSTSRASARRARNPPGTRASSVVMLVVVGVLPFVTSVPPLQAGPTANAMPLTPIGQLGQNPGRGAGIFEDGGAHLHGVGAGDDELGRVFT